MYAVIVTGGKQYRVWPGARFEVEQLKRDAGDEVVFDQVLLVGDGANIRIGRPFVEGARVKATVLGLAKGPKIINFKHSGRTTLRRKTGHRQHYTRIRIDSIEA
ncbi:MAG: 50S ribosomal protein L21 [Anaerolineae bacterium]|nr:50S ribosomal protein L21 [Caldilineales bacterium]MCX7852045.1 50S ribosomal protein L21 [Caldilineales bacterium]MDW8269889.1 50S ribosomal protein L21 [Anaerolineae bacterium]